MVPGSWVRFLSSHPYIFPTNLFLLMKMVAIKIEGDLEINFPEGDPIVTVKTMHTIFFFSLKEDSFVCRHNKEKQLILKCSHGKNRTRNLSHLLLEMFCVGKMFLLLYVQAFYVYCE